MEPPVKPAPGVRIAFHIHTATPKGYTYESVHLHPHGRLETPYPPNVGDLVHLPGYPTSHQVVSRAWSYPQHGSADWPYGARPSEGPLLDLIVEPAIGPFNDDATETEDD